MAKVHEEFESGCLIESPGYGKMEVAPKRLYVLCDYKLDPVYSCVQGAHAVAQYLLDHQGDDVPTWRNESKVSHWRKKLKWLKRDFTPFYEPDLGMQLTAIAVEDSGNLFKNLKLVKL